MDTVSRFSTLAALLCMGAANAVFAAGPVAAPSTPYRNASPPTLTPPPSAPKQDVRVEIRTATRLVMGTQCTADFEFDADPNLAGRLAATCRKHQTLSHSQDAVVSTGLVVVGVNGIGFADCHLRRFEHLSTDAVEPLRIELACADDNAAASTSR